MSSAAVPNVTLNNGQTIPIIGLGTWNSPRGEVEQAVKDAIDAGYRHIDGAYIYGNENEVGQALSAKIDEGVIKREDVFITSKLWNTFHRADLVRPALLESLKNLKTEYLDLYLIHWPLAFKEDGELFPKNDQGKIEFSDVDYLDTWIELEKAVDDGLVKSIGLSNFNRSQIERVLKIARIQPVVNQIECHPYLTQTELSEFCAKKNITVIAYSPLGSPKRPWATSDDPLLLEEPKLKELAVKHGRDIGQVLIRYQIQRGHVVIPKSVTKSRIASNFDVFGFELSAEDLVIIESFERNGRLCPMTSGIGHKHHPFENDKF